MPDLNKKLFSSNILSHSIRHIIGAHVAPTALILGMSCAMSQIIFAENRMVISNPDTEAVDEAIAEEEQEQQELINDAIEDQQAAEREQTSLDQAVSEFQADEVYQLQDSDIPAPDQAMLNEIRKRSMLINWLLLCNSNRLLCLTFKTIRVIRVNLLSIPLKHQRKNVDFLPDYLIEMRKTLTLSKSCLRLMSLCVALKAS